MGDSFSVGDSGLILLQRLFDCYGNGVSRKPPIRLMTPAIRIEGAVAPGRMIMMLVIFGTLRIFTASPRDPVGARMMGERL